MTSDELGRRRWWLRTLLLLQLLAVYGVLLVPGRALVGRDIAEYQVPLRIALVRAVEGANPGWNALTQGGQPLLSDPSYAAFYPPTWLNLLLPVHRAISLLVVLHALLAAAGAWHLAKRLGCRENVALLASTGYAGGGLFVSLIHAHPMLPAMAWFPWMLAATFRQLDAEGTAQRLAAMTWAGGIYSMILLAGEPATILAVTLSVALVTWTSRPRRTLEPLAAGLVGIGLASTQLVPAASRLLASQRAGGLEWQAATTWSMSPIRVAELFFPRLLGDPSRMGEGLYYGWGLQDLDYPYLLVLTPGLILVALGLAALFASGRTPHRLAWIAIAASGVVLALGRHTPIFRWILFALPSLSINRYPEKFFLLTYVALVFAGACGWEQILRDRERGDPKSVTLPLALLAPVPLVLTGLIVFSQCNGSLLRRFITLHQGLAPTPELLERATSVYLRDATILCALALAAVLLLVIARWQTRVSSTVLSAGVWSVTALELLFLTSPLVSTIPSQVFEEPPPLAIAAETRGVHRLWSTVDVDQRPEVYLKSQNPRSWLAETKISRLDPATGVLWGFQYALSVDAALTTTSPQRRARNELVRQWASGDRELLHRILGAWGIDGVLVRRGARELFVASESGDTAPAFLAGNPNALAWARAVSLAELFPNPDAALDAARLAGFPFDSIEYLATGERDAQLRFDPSATVTTTLDTVDGASIHIEARGPALLVVAETFDPGWHATVLGEERPVLETALGYMAIPLEPGGGDVLLTFRDSLTWVGAAVSIATLALFAALLVFRGRKIAQSNRP
ncbi:MAG: hypothetical protein KDB94_04610 [Acidobacteria bacterium]|nr:hypothetical protein [Acidobacteriota bacterium]